MPTHAFAADRTRSFRERVLSEFNKQKISDIEEFGFQVLSIVPGRTDKSGFFGFSYTVGAYDTGGQPEVIAVGLKRDTLS